MLSLRKWMVLECTCVHAGPPRTFPEVIASGNAGGDAAGTIGLTRTSQMSQLAVTPDTVFEADVLRPSPELRVW